MSKHLSFDPVRKAVRGNAMVANPALAGDETGGLGPPARSAYASERNVAYSGNVNPPRNRKGGSGNPSPKGKRAPALSRPALLV